MAPGHPSPLRGQKYRVRERQEGAYDSTHAWAVKEPAKSGTASHDPKGKHLKLKKRSMNLLARRVPTDTQGRDVCTGESGPTGYLLRAHQTPSSPLANQKGSGVSPEQVPPNPQTFLSEECHGAIPGCYWGLWRALREGLDAGAPPRCSREGSVQSPVDDNLDPRAC